MTFDDFQATVRARFPSIVFVFDHEGSMFRARNGLAAVTYVDWSRGYQWRFKLQVIRDQAGYGPDLDAAIEAHRQQLRTIVTDANTLELLP